MAVPEQTPYIEHTGNGVTTSFALKFQCESKDHLIVLVDGIEPPIATWSLTGGNVVFTTAPAAGKKITLQRNTPFNRTTDYQSYNNSFRPPAVNKDFDWIWWKLQELGVADWILGARIDALKSYVDDRDDELRAYLMEEIRKQGVALDQLEEYYNYLMQRLAQIAVDKGWDASFVVDGDKNQHEINNLFRLIEISPEYFGYKAGDATEAFKAAAMYAKERNIPLVAKNPNGYFITESLDFYTPTDISKVIMPSDGVFRTLSVKTQKAPTSVAISSLSGLTEFSNKVTGFPLSAVGKYIRITSTDVLTERNNAPSNMPYNKNTAFRLIDSTGAISPSLDMSFDAGSTAEVSIIPAETRIKVKIGALETTGTGLNNNSIIIERDSVDFYIDDVSGSTGFRTLLTLTGNDCNFFSPVIKDAQYTGLGYGISIGLCCDTNIYSMKGSNCRTTLDGRHGANVTVHNSRLETAGTHWGNNYVFKDCDIDTVTWAGKDLSVMGGSLRNFISMRADVAMCIGKLRLGDGLVAHSISTLIVPSANIIAGFFTSPRRLFDSVFVDDIVCTENILGIYAHGAIAVFAADWNPPTDFYFNNISAPKSNQLNLCYLNLTNATALTAEGRIRVSNIKAKVVKPFMARGFSKYTSSYGYDVRAVDCGKSFIQCDANAFSRLKLVDSTLIGANRINGSVARGDMIFDDCVIEHDPSIATAGLFNVEARKGFVNVEYRGLFSNSGSVNGVTMYSIAARAAVGATGFPVPLTNHINRTLYQRDEVSFSFNPPSIPANGYIRQEFDIPGAQLGDSIFASFDVYNAALEVSGSVSATNKVSVLFKNLSAAAVDLEAGLISIKRP